MTILSHPEIRAHVARGNGLLRGMGWPELPLAPPSAFVAAFDRATFIAAQVPVKETPERRGLREAVLAECSALGDAITKAVFQPFTPEEVERLRDSEYVKQLVARINAEAGEKPAGE